MTVLVAVPDSPEGRFALTAAAQEAALLGADLIVMNLALTPLADHLVPPGATVIERTGRGDRDPAEAVLDEMEARAVERLVVGVKRRTAVGKALLGSISQRLLLESPVPVLAVKMGPRDG